MNEIKQRLKSPVVWAGIAAIIISVSGINPENMTEWGILAENVLNIFKNTFILISIIVSIFAFLNNPKDKEHF